MALTSIVIDSGTVSDSPIDSRQRDCLVNVGNYLKGVAGGGNKATVLVTARDATVRASGTVTIASGAGTITATINGVGVSITWATSDTNSAALLAAAINASANALVAGLVTATSAAGVVTITSVAPGVAGNTQTLAATGTGAAASGTRLAGGVETLYAFSA